MIFGTGFFGGCVGGEAFLGRSLGADDFLTGSEPFFELPPLAFALGSSLRPNAGLSFCLAVGGDWLLVRAASSLDILDEAGPGLEDEEPGLIDPEGLVPPF